MGAVSQLIDDIEARVAIIKGRVADLERQRANLLPHHQDCVNEQDWHGAWDGAVYIANIECEITGLKFALKALGGEP